MPRPIRYTLLCDGSSDAVLSYPIEWLLADLGWHEASGSWADLRTIRPPVRSLHERVLAASRWYPCDILFIHRDAERQPTEYRLREIRDAVQGQGGGPPYVCVVPVQTSEAWLLHDEMAIRRASGNPRGRLRLNLPAVARIESVREPKTVLRSALIKASGTSGRRRKQARRDFGAMRHRVAELVDTYEPLRALAAFRRFEMELGAALVAL